MKTFLLLVAALTLAMPVNAGHCSTWTTAISDVTVDGSAVGGPTYYAADVICTLAYCPGTTFGFWIYEESNGIPGLQRADEAHDTTCHGQIRGDTILF